MKLISGFIRSGLWKKIKSTGFNYSRNKNVRRGLNRSF